MIEGVDLSGKRAIVTGASSGIGVETARALASAGAEVTLAVRNVVAGERTAAEIGGDASVARLDLADRSTIAAFAGAWDEPLDILVNNAGVMALPDLELTDDGWEMQFAVNHLGHFELTRLLREALVAAGNARVVSVSSAAHLVSPVVFEDINFERRPYHPSDAYGQSKTANVLFAVALTKRGIASNALMPGAIPTNLQRHMPGGRPRSPDVKTVEQCREQPAGEREVAEVVRADVHLEPVLRLAPRQRHHARVVHEDVDRAGVASGEVANRGQVGEVQLLDRELGVGRRRADAVGRFGAPAGVAHSERHVGAAASELLRDLKPEAAVGAGHDSAPAGQVRNVLRRPRHRG